MAYIIRPLTPELWPAFEALFGRAGASNGCWCMYWRLGPDYHRRPRAQNKAALRRLVNAGPPPGLVAFAGDQAVGWCQLTERAALPWLARVPAAAPDAEPVWALSCFFVHRRYRRQGVMAALIAAAVTAARRAGAPALEAYPVGAEASPGSSNRFTGTVAAFARAGFQVVARRDRYRVVMRRDLRRKRPARSDASP